MGQKKKMVHLIKVLSQTKPADLNKILSYLSDDAINDICECIYNVIYTDLKLSARKKSHLRKCIKSNCSMHKKIKTITSKKEPIFKRRKALNQVGGFLPLLLGTALPFLVDLIFGKK